MEQIFLTRASTRHIGVMIRRETDIELIDWPSRASSLLMKKSSLCRSRSTVLFKRTVPQARLANRGQRGLVATSDVKELMPAA